MNCSNNRGVICSALLIGTAIGGVIGVLFAPAKGRDTRRKLARMPEEADALTDSLKEKFNTLIDEIRRDMETAKGK